MLRWTVHLKGATNIYPAAVAVRKKVYSFGGYNTLNDWHQIDVHIFNTVSFRWTRLPPVTAGRERPLEVPSNCVCHAAVLVEDAVYIWGGIFNFEIEDNDDSVTINGFSCNILFAFNIDTHRWFEPSVSGTVPTARFSHSACALGKVMYIYGGSIQTGIINEVFKLDTATMIWCFIDNRGRPAHVSSCHSATIIGTKMFIFGGRGNNREIYNDIRVFDTDTECWVTRPSVPQLLPEGSMSHPEGRMSHSAFAYEEELYIFGGSNYGQEEVFNDLWRFNAETFTWTKVEPKGDGPYLLIMLSCCIVGDRIVLFGRYKAMTHDDGLYILDLRPSLQALCKLAVIQHSLEMSELPHSIRWELEAMTTNSN